MRPDSGHIHSFCHNENPTLHPGEDVQMVATQRGAWIIEASEQSANAVVEFYAPN